MKKSLLLLVLGICSLQNIWAQYNCQNEAMDSIAALYYQDAVQLIARSVYAQDPLGLGSEIALPQEKINVLFSALMTIYEDQELPHWDEVIEQYKIHSKTEVETQNIRLLVNTAFLWRERQTENLLKFSSGSLLLDQLLSDYNFSLNRQAKTVFFANDANTYLEIMLHAEQALNIPVLLRVIRSVEGVVEAESILETSAAASEKDIEFLETNNYVQFTFRYSWDCSDSTACAENHFWTYRVFPNCRAEFVEERGSILPVREITSFIATGLYPNPTTDRVSVQLLGPTGKDIHVILFSSLGQIIQSEFVQSQSGLIKLDYSLKDLPVGMYFLGLVSEGKVLTEKIIKR